LKFGFLLDKTLERFAQLLIAPRISLKGLISAILTRELTKS